MCRYAMKWKYDSDHIAWLFTYDESNQYVSNMYVVGVMLVLEIRLQGLHLSNIL